MSENDHFKGTVVKVKVMEVDAARKRIALSIKQTEVPSTQNTKSAKSQI